MPGAFSIPYRKEPMALTAPVTNIPNLDAFLAKVATLVNTLDSKALPADGWALTDLEASVSEIIGDKRDLIDIVTKWDSAANSFAQWENLTAQQKAAIDDLKAQVESLAGSADEFEDILLWWDANAQTIHDVKEHTEVIHGDMESIHASEQAVTQMKADVTTMRGEVATDLQTTKNNKNAAVSAKTAAEAAQRGAESAEADAEDAKAEATTQATNAAVSASSASSSAKSAAENAAVTVGKISASAVVIDVTDKIVDSGGARLCESAIVTIVGGTAQLEILKLTYQKGTWGNPCVSAVVEAKYRPSSSSSASGASGQIVYAESGKESACLKMLSTGWLYGIGFTVGKPYSGKITWPLSSMQVPILDAEQKLMEQVAASAAAAKTSETNAAASAATAETAAETAVARVVDGAPEDLDTIREVAEYAQDNRDVMDTLNAAIGQKAPLQHRHQASDIDGLDQKSDKGHKHPVEDVTGLGDRLDGLEQALDGKAQETHTHTSSEISDAASTVTADRVVRADSTGHIAVPEPTLPADPTPKSYVDNATAGLIRFETSTTVPTTFEDGVVYLVGSFA